MRFITMMGTAALSMTAATLAQSTTINEIRTGAGNAEYIELKGTPGASLAGLTIVVLGDGTSTGAVITRTGVVEWLYRFAATDVIGSNGYLVLHNPGANPAAVPADTNGAFPFPIDLAATNLPWGYQTPTGSSFNTQLEGDENITYMLVSDYTGTDTFQTRAPNNGADGQDLDTNDDGILDITPWSAILDSVAFKESNGAAPTGIQDWWYSPNTCGPYISRTVAITGTVIAAWDFQTTTTGGTALSTSGSAQPRAFTANFGSGTLYADGTNGASSWTAAANAELNAFAGTDTNATGGMATTTTSPAALALVNSSANGKAVVFKFPMASILGLSVSYATQRTSTGFATQQWAWSTDATTWTDIDVISPDASFGTTPKILAPLSALDGAADAYLRMTFAGCTSASGNNRLDNVKMLTNAVTSVVNRYAGPTVGIKQADGTWFIGALATTTTGGSQDTPGSANYAAPNYTCGDPVAGDCAITHGNAFCSDACCCAYVGGLDPFCITVRWDSFCVTAAAGCAANCTALPCPADFTGDRIVGGADLGILLGDWGGSERDLNGDGITNGADLGSLLGAWGNCP